METLFLSFLFFLQNTDSNATGNLTEKLLLPVVSAFVSMLLTGLVAWYLFGGKSANRRSDAAIISQLQKDIDIWIEKLNALRRESQKIEDDNRENKQNCKEDKEAIFDGLCRVIRLTQDIEAKSFSLPEFAPVRRDMIRVNEMLEVLRKKVA